MTTVYPDSPLDRPLVYVTGKGGAGKTTVALALALLARDAGRRTVLCEVAAQGRVPALYGREPLPDGLEHELEDDLFAATLDPEAALREWFSTLLPGPLDRVLTQSGTFSAFAQAAPGAKELTLAVKLCELGRPDRWSDREPFDTVVVDAPASGHGLGLLRAPGTFADIARVGPLARQAAAVRDQLADSMRTAVVAVAEPSELSVTETLELDGLLELAAIVVNGITPRRFTREHVARVSAATDGRVAGVVELAAARTREEQAQVRRLRRGASAPVHTLPFLAVDALDLDDVDGLAAVLGRELARR